MVGGWLLGWGERYERKVDLPQEGSPRRRMRTVGGESIGGSGARGHCESEETGRCYRRLETRSSWYFRGLGKPSLTLERISTQS